MNGPEQQDGEKVQHGAGAVQNAYPSVGRRRRLRRVYQPVEQRMNDLEQDVGAEQPGADEVQRPYPSVGQRIRLRHDVPRFDDFLAKEGMTGTVNVVDPDPQEPFISAKMDQPLSDDPVRQRSIEQEWGNCIHWYSQYFPDTVVTALDDFLDDCEYIE